jgi:hypothetical protein
VNLFAFCGGFIAVAAGIIGYYITGTWEILAVSITGLLVILIMLAPPGNKKAPPVVRRRGVQGKPQKRKR